MRYLVCRGSLRLLPSRSRRLRRQRRSWGVWTPPRTDVYKSIAGIPNSSSLKYPHQAVPAVSVQTLSRHQSDAPDGNMPTKRPRIAFWAPGTAREAGLNEFHMPNSSTRLRYLRENVTSSHPSGKPQRHVSYATGARLPLVGTR